MITVNIHEAKAHLLKLVDQAAKGEAFVIAKAGKPLVKVAPLPPAAPPPASRDRPQDAEGPRSVPAGEISRSARANSHPPSPTKAHASWGKPPWIAGAPARFPS